MTPVQRTLSRVAHRGWRCLLILWASPWSLLGLCWGILGLATGGTARRGPGILEFHGGAVSWGLGQLPGYACAMTLGHVVVGRSAAALDLSQAHELVHVRQYERWGPFFYSGLSDVFAGPVAARTRRVSRQSV